MVQAVRSGQSVCDVARAFGVSVGTVAAWVKRARGQRIDRVTFAHHKPGRAWNRTAPEVEQCILSARNRLRETSVLVDKTAVGAENYRIDVSMSFAGTSSVLPSQRRWSKLKTSRAAAPVSRTAAWVFNPRGEGTPPPGYARPSVR